MGGPTVARADLPITLAKVWSDKPGQYEEPAGWRVVGVEAGNVVAVSRLHQWTVKKADSVYESDLVTEIIPNELNPVNGFNLVNESAPVSVNPDNEPNPVNGIGHGSGSLFVGSLGLGSLESCQ
jgi:hypothetical protein